MPSSLWPLWDLRVQTSRLTLRYPTDADLPRLVEITQAIRQTPGSEWFWREACGGSGPDALDYSTRAAQALWNWRAQWRKDSWNLALLAQQGQQIVGVVETMGEQFGLTSSAELGLRVDPTLQGQGYGQEMVRAALHLLFEHIGAQEAIWACFADNQASNAEAAATGFRANGSKVIAYREQRREESLYRLLRTDWQPEPEVHVENLDPCLPFFGRTGMR